MSDRRRFSVMAPLHNLDVDFEQEPMRFRSEMSLSGFELAPMSQFAYVKSEIPEVTFTDWDAECELLKEYLSYRIDNYTSELIFAQDVLSLNNVVLDSINIDPAKLMRMFSEMGFLIVNCEKPTKLDYHHPMTFDQWKIRRNVIKHPHYMTKETLAAQLNGCEYRNELSRELEGAADIHGLVVVFGSSDDLMEFRGAVNEEIGAWDGGKATIYLAADGNLKILSDQDFEELKEQLDDTGISLPKTVEIEAVWTPEELEDTSWLIKTELPHATFDVMEDDELYCRGIVIDMKDIKAALEN